MSSSATARIRGWAPAGTRLFFTRFFNWQPALIGWGLFAGATAVFLVERIPAFRRDIFSKLPVIGDRYAEYRVHEEEEEE